MEYVILQENTPYSLAQSVENHIEKGWKLQGGIAADEHGIYQAMVKEEE